MRLGFKTELKLNNKHRTLLAKHAGVARHAWNWGLGLTKAILDNNKANPNDKMKFPTAIDLHKWSVALVKPEHPWYYEVSKCAPQYALRQLFKAWKQAFKKVRGVPKFKKKGRNDSFTVDGSITIEQFRIKVPVIGWLKTYERLPSGIIPKSVTISRQADRWFISLKIEAEENVTVKTRNVVGVDLGVKALATLSTGEVFEGAASYKKLEKKLSRLQYRHRHKVKRSNNWKKAQVKIARLHRRIANIRKDTLHKLTSYLSKNHAVIAIEDLNGSGMLANRKLAKVISDMGFYEFRRQLEYKCLLYGSQLVVVDRWFPSSKTCFKCKIVKSELTLAERIFLCGSCGWTCDRDENAALNLECYALSYSVNACGRGAADSPG
jgi:putative transposase